MYSDVFHFNYFFFSKYFAILRNYLVKTWAYLGNTVGDFWYCLSTVYYLFISVERVKMLVLFSVSRPLYCKSHGFLKSDLSADGKAATNDIDIYI